MIPYGKQNISDADIQSVVDTLKSDWITQGPVVEQFEKAVAQYTGASHSIAVNSATSALHLACLALGLGKGDRLWTSPNTFVASANCALYCGADIDFVDIDAETYNMSTTLLREKLETAKLHNTLPKIVIPVHFSGQSCDMNEIHALSKEYGFSIIEDASHAIGGKYLKKPIGCCQYSDITVFSFHPVKIITTGEGGMLLTNNEKLADTMRRQRSHGITRDIGLMDTSFDKMTDGAWYYQQTELGFNYRLTDIQSALGLSQMKRLDEFVSIRHELAKRYDDILSQLAVVLPYRNEQSYSALHLYVIKIKLDEVSKTRKEVFDSLRDAEIGVNIHYIPVHTQPYYKNLGFNLGDFPQAERYYEAAISLPLFTDLTHEQQDQVATALEDALR